MRDIKFRGKSFGNGEFVFGDLTRYSEEMSYITVDLIEGEVYQVDSKTVGQFTGLKDKNGKEIYEGDICRVSSDTFYSNSYATLEESWELIMQVVFCNYAFIFRCLQDKHLEILLAETLWEDFEIEIVGNIYENPELLEVKNAD